MVYVILNISSHLRPYSFHSSIALLCLPLRVMIHLYRIRSSSSYCTDTEISVIEETFKSLTDRQDIGILLINQSVTSHRQPTSLVYSPSSNKSIGTITSSTYFSSLLSVQFVPSQTCFSSHPFISYILSRPVDGYHPLTHPLNLFISYPT